MEHRGPEQEVRPEEEAFRALEALPRALGYEETSEMAGMRLSLVEAMIAGEDTRDMATRYRLLAEEVSDRSGDGSKRLGMLVHIALMRYAGGRYDDYLEGLEDALIIAEQEGFEDAALVLSEVLALSA